ncbi:hypothetical protein RJ641_034212 [Dillenia turbinata]|uniref:Uncharacterized protein n=1 Tax=Dillenia turbinata TaxID=194707 RepID=A0AAN8W184_9MAGN
MVYNPYYIGGGLTIQHQHYNYDSGINTLFISGLPDDVKPHEIHNLFRHRPSFDSCQLLYTGHGNQAVKQVSEANNDKYERAICQFYATRSYANHANYVQAMRKSLTEQFFAKAGFPCPSKINPSDHFLYCINSDFDIEIRLDLDPFNDLATSEIKVILVEKYKQSKYTERQNLRLQTSE